MANSKQAQAAVAESIRRLKALDPQAWERIQDEVYAEFGVTRRKRLSPDEKAARAAAEAQRQAKEKILALAKKANVRVQFAVTSTEDAQANIEILQATAPVDAEAQIEAAQARYAAVVAENGPLQVL
jgi:ribosomal protein S25